MYCLWPHPSCAVETYPCDGYVFGNRSVFLKQHTKKHDITSLWVGLKDQFSLYHYLRPYLLNVLGTCFVQAETGLSPSGLLVSNNWLLTSWPTTQSFPVKGTGIKKKKIFFGLFFLLQNGPTLSLESQMFNLLLLI